MRIIHADGTTTPLQTIYIGYDEDDGVYVWATVPGSRQVGPGDRVALDALPGRTSILLSAESTE